MLQKILNLFRRKKKVVFDERDNYVHDPVLFLQSLPFPSSLDNRSNDQLSDSSNFYFGGGTSDGGGATGEY
jgi:uncharacterized membrane protein YgcG